MKTFLTRVLSLFIPIVISFVTPGVANALEPSTLSQDSILSVPDESGNITTTVHTADNRQVSVVIPSSIKVYDKSSDYWRKFKIMRAVGWSAFGVGTTTALLGGLMQAAFSATYKGDFIGPCILMVATGGTLMLASIPILIVGSNYKKKAAINVGITPMQETPLSFYGNNGVNKFTPGIGVSLTF